MKNLDLNACGVQEMNQQEMVDINGGSISNVIKKIGAIVVAIGTVVWSATKDLAVAVVDAAAASLIGSIGKLNQVINGVIQGK